MLGIDRRRAGGCGAEVRATVVGRRSRTLLEELRTIMGQA